MTINRISALIVVILVSFSFTSCGTSEEGLAIDKQIAADQANLDNFSAMFDSDTEKESKTA